MQGQNTYKEAVFRNEEVEKVDGILDKMIVVIEDSRDEVFRISESARMELMEREEELLRTQTMIMALIEEIGALELEEKNGRNLYLAVSKELDKFSKEEIQKIFSKTASTQTMLGIKREYEKNLILKRNSLEFHIKNARQVLARSEALTSKMSMALEYLTGSLLDEIAEVKLSRNIGMKVIKFQESERSRIAKDMHDGPAQYIANGVLKVDYCEKLIEKDTKKALLELGNLKKHLRLTAAEIRRIVYGLMPMSLQDLGLIPTLVHYIEEAKSKTELNIQFSHSNKLDRKLDALVALSIFRIIQECINNAEKHSGADQCCINLKITRRELFLEIVDNGRGFVLNPHEGLKSDSGFGIYGMKERVRLLGGSFELHSIAEGFKGTKIFVNVPLD